MRSKAPIVWLGTDIRVVKENGQYFSTHPALSDYVIERSRPENGGIILVARKGRKQNDQIHLLTAMDKVALLDEGEGSPLRRLFGLVVQVLRLPIRHNDACVARIPEVVGTSLWIRTFCGRGGTVANVVAEGRAAIGFIGRPVPGAAFVFEAMVRIIAKRSSATIYVTSTLLQRLYPPGNSLTIGSSNVSLPVGWVRDSPRTFQDGQASNFIMIGGMDSDTKGFDLAIRALSQISQSGTRFTLSIVGDGSLRESLAKLTQDLDVADRVTFCGFVSDRDDLAALLDASDLLLMPSRSEGLPRAAVEAQSRGVPCLASNVGGLPEAVPQAGLFPVGDVNAFVRLLLQVNQDGDFASTLSKEGLARASAILDSARPERFWNIVQSVVSQST